jgi:hypothetical protein
MERRGELITFYDATTKRPEVEYQGSLEMWEA